MNGVESPLLEKLEIQGILVLLFIEDWFVITESGSNTKSKFLF
jgi:hypothetical protein